MAKSYYVKFDVPENLVSPIYESLRVAVETGKVKRGTNEATKAIERGISKLIIIAEDVEPPEVVAHLPIICEEQKAAYDFVPTKQELGKALGIEVTCGAAAILDSGDAQHIVRIYAESDSEKNLETLMKEYTQKIKIFLDR